MKKKLWILLALGVIFALGMSACVGVNLPTEEPGVASTWTPTISPAVPAIGGESEAYPAPGFTPPMPSNTPTLAPTATLIPETEVEVTVDVQIATATPWPSIFMAKNEVVAVPAGYTIAGDFSICLKADGECYKTYLDDDPLTTSVWTFDESGYARYDFGSGWAERVTDPQVFVDAQLSDGCGDGCKAVGSYRWPRDAAYVVAGFTPGPTVGPTATPTAAATPLATALVTPAAPATPVAAADWQMPSWLSTNAAVIEQTMKPEALPLVPPDELTYQTPPQGDCYALANPLDSCTTGRLRPISFKDVEIAPAQLLRMTGDAISIRWAGTNDLLANQPVGDEKHDNWIVLNLSSKDIEVDINAPYGSDRSWYTATNGWTPALTDELMRQMIQDFNLQLRDATGFAATPVPNCEASTGCTYSNIRVVIVFDDQVLVFVAKWFELQASHWQAYPPTSYTR